MRRVCAGKLAASISLLADVTAQRPSPEMVIAKNAQFNLPRLYSWRGCIKSREYAFDERKLNCKKGWEWISCLEWLKPQYNGKWIRYGQLWPRLFIPDLRLVQTRKKWLGSLT
jgi:hypothetical protein